MAPQINKRSRTQKSKVKRTGGKGRPAKAQRTKANGQKERASGGSRKTQVGKNRSAKRKPSAPSDGAVRKIRPRSANTTEGDRLQKVLASAGIASRRECEQLILDGRVEVNGDVITELGTRVVVGKDEIRFDCELIELSKPRYYLVHKPIGVVSTNRDQEGRPRVIDLVPPAGHLFTVGRLDRSSEGLILVTNDGELANKLAHPRYEIPKVYRVTVAGHPSHKALQQLRRGVWLAEGQVRVSELVIKKRQTKNTILEMVLTEGRNREIRRMAAKVGHKVLELRRIAMGPLRLGDIPAGAYRELTGREIKAIKDTLRGKTRSGRRRPATKSGGRTAGAGRKPTARGDLAARGNGINGKGGPRPTSRMKKKATSSKTSKRTTATHHLSKRKSSGRKVTQK